MKQNAHVIPFSPADSPDRDAPGGVVRKAVDLITLVISCAGFISALVFLFTMG